MIIIHERPVDSWRGEFAPHWKVYGPYRRGECTAYFYATTVSCTRYPRGLLRVEDVTENHAGDPLFLRPPNVRNRRMKWAAWHLVTGGDRHPEDPRCVPAVWNQWAKRHAPFSLIGDTR